MTEKILSTLALVLLSASTFSTTAMAGEDSESTIPPGCQVVFWPHYTCE